MQDTRDDALAAARRVLQRYVGTWDVVAEVDGRPSATGETTGQLVLDGHFLQRTGWVKTVDGSNDFDIISMLGYDANADAFHVTAFLSNGLHITSDATWDETSQTMTEIRHYGDVTQTTESQFVEDGVEQWTMVNMDADGHVISAMSGTNRRRTRES